jgi:hypothetical protein
MITPIDTGGEAATASSSRRSALSSCSSCRSVTARANHRTEILRGASQPGVECSRPGGTFQVLGQRQQPRCVRCQPDHGHRRFEPLNCEDELCAQRTRVVLDEVVMPHVEPPGVQ